MPITPKGKSILREMVETYGGSLKKAKSVFFAMINAGKLTGVHK